MRATYPTSLIRVKCVALPNPELLSSLRACFYRWPPDRFQHCSHSLVFLLGVLEEVTNRGEQWWGVYFSYWVAGNAKKKKKGKRRKRQDNTSSLSHPQGFSPQGSTSGQYIGIVSWQILVSVLISCWPFSHESLIQKTILDNLIGVSIFSRAFVSAEILAVLTFVIRATKHLWFLKVQFVRWSIVETQFSNTDATCPFLLIGPLTHYKKVDTFSNKCESTASSQLT